MINPVLWFNAKFLNFNAKIPSSLLDEVMHSSAKRWLNYWHWAYQSLSILN